MGFTKDKSAYNLDDVSNVTTEGWKPVSQFPTGKGDTGLDGVISVDTSADMTNRHDETYPEGARVELTATTGLPMGEGAKMEFVGGTGTVTDWPKAFDEK
jgi:hypothetical protein